MADKPNLSVKDLAVDAAFIGFLVLNAIQIITIITIMVFVLLDIKRKIKQEAAVTSSTSLHDSSVKYADGVSAKIVARYRRDLKKEPKGTSVAAPKRKRKLLYLLKDGGEGRAIFNVLKQITSSIRDIEMYYDDNKLPAALSVKLKADPYVNTSSILSKFAKMYSPMHARASWSQEQLKGELIMAPSVSAGSSLSASPMTTLVLPTGHVINKARYMDEKDMETNAPAPYTLRCAAYDIASRINLHGYGTAPHNEEALAAGNTELHLCPCDNHKHS